MTLLELEDVTASYGPVRTDATVPAGTPAGIFSTERWDYGTKGSFKNIALLGTLCFTLFASFVGLGIIVSTILGRGGDRVGRLYFADLIGAGLGCVLAIPLIVSLGPPQVVLLAGLIFAVVGLVMVPEGVALRVRAPGAAAIPASCNLVAASSAVRSAAQRASAAASSPLTIGRPPPSSV